MDENSQEFARVALHKKKTSVPNLLLPLKQTGHIAEPEVIVMHYCTATRAINGIRHNYFFFSFGTTFFILTELPTQN